MIKIINMVVQKEFKDLDVGDLFTFDFMADDPFTLPPIWIKTDTITDGKVVVVSMDGVVDHATPTAKVFPIKAILKASFYEGNLETR